MENENKKSRTAVILELLVGLLFFCGTAAITIGLWNLHSSVGLIFLGISFLYLASCASSVNAPGKEGK